MKNTKLYLWFLMSYFGLLIQTQAQSEAYLAQAHRLFEAQNYEEAITTYREVLILDRRNTEAIYYLGISLLEINNPKEAQVFFDSLNHISPDEFADFDFWRGKSCYFNMNFHESYDHLIRYKNQGKNKKLVKECIRLIPFLENAIQISKEENTYKIEHLNQHINSSYSEFGAVVAQDGKRLIFTRQNQPIASVLERKKRGAKKEILISELQADDSWSSAKRINNQKTSSGYEVAIQLLDADDRRMLVYQDGDLKISQFEDNEWKIPRLIDKGINTSKTEKFACVYENGNKIIFSSNHGRGKSLDLFQAVLQTDGLWSKPIPLAELNTPEDEDSPYITNGGKTLYFSSKGHQNMGGYDVFISHYNPVAKRWSNPKNLGVPINSVADDLYFSIMGEVGYLTSNRVDGFGMEDIYRFYTFSEINITGHIIYRKSTNPCQACQLVVRSDEKKFEATTDSTGFYSMKLPFHQSLNLSVYKNDAIFYEEVNSLIINPKRPKQQSRNYYIGYDPIRSEKLNLEGNIMDKTTGKPVPAQVQLIAVGTGKIIATKTADITGKYNFMLPDAHQKYRLEASYSGYFYATKLVSSETAVGDAIEVDMALEALKIGQVFILKNVYFESGSDVLTDKSFEELDRLYRLLYQNPSIRLEISGHTDNIGDVGSNLRLSDKRAKAVQNYLRGKGLIPSRLEAVGYGDTRPIASNDDEEDGRELNRRIEIQILTL